MQQIKLLEDGGADEDDIINARCRYRGTSQEYSRFSKAMGIPQQRERVTVDGLGNIGVGKYTKSVAKSEKSGIIDSQEMFRSKIVDRGNVTPISEKRFNDLTIEARKNGAVVLRGGKEIEEHLDRANATAAVIGDTLLFREQASVSDVLEETYHFMQNKNGLNADKKEPLRTILNEIDAKQYLIRNAKKYNIPRAETEETEKHLERYLSELEKIHKEVLQK